MTGDSLIVNYLETSRQSFGRGCPNLSIRLGVDSFLDDQVHRDKCMEVEKRLNEHDDKKGCKTVGHCCNCGTGLSEISSLDLLYRVHGHASALTQEVACVNNCTAWLHPD